MSEPKQPVVPDGPAPPRLALTPSHTQSPVDALRLIRAVLGDEAMTHAQRGVVIAVILRAKNTTGRAWASYRGLMAEHGFSPTTIREALRKARGRYLTPVAKGDKGAVHYQVSALHRLERATQSEAQALHSAPSSATPSVAILAPASGSSSGPKRARRKKPPPDSRVKAFIDFFATEYQQAVGRAYVVAGGKDGQLVKSLLGKVGGNGDAVAELQRATRNMLADDWGRPRADIGLLSSKINSWLKNEKGKRIDYRKGF